VPLVLTFIPTARCLTCSPRDGRCGRARGSMAAARQPASWYTCLLDRATRLWLIF